MRNTLAGRALRSWRPWLIVVALIAVAAIAAACGDDDDDDDGGEATTAPTTAATQAAKLSGSIQIDGSSTVFPVTQAYAEEFMKTQKDVKVTVGISGTGGGFKRFCAGETDISDASRPISATEKDACAKAGIEYQEIYIAYDGLSVIVNPKDTFVDCLTVTELNKIWGKDSTITNWKDVRAGFPDKKLTLFGPGTDSGTFDYFTEEINKKAKESRSDYTASEDDNVLVTGISQQEGSLGYFGYAYYIENQGKLRLLGVDGEKGGGCVKPGKETIETGKYAPLSRPIFIYVKKASAKKPEVKAFVDYYLDAKNRKLIGEVGYIAGPDSKYNEVITAWKAFAQ